MFLHQIKKRRCQHRSLSVSLFELIGLTGFVIAGTFQHHSNEAGSQWSAVFDGDERRRTDKKGERVSVFQRLRGRAENDGARF